MQRILDAAESCFRQHGYVGASMRQISDAAGVSKSLVHYHFGSKEKLVAAVQERLNERVAASVRAAVRRRGRTRIERALVGLDVLIEAAAENDYFATHAALAAGALSNAALKEEVLRVHAGSRRLFVELMTESLGDEPLPFSIESAADALIATFVGAGLSAALGEPRERVAATLAALRSFIALALAAPAEARGEGAER